VVKEARVMWDGIFNGERLGGPLHLRVDHIGDLVAHFGGRAHELHLEHLQSIARDLAVAVELVDGDFAGRIIIDEPSHFSPETS
jgi:hypothetical protein